MARKKIRNINSRQKEIKLDKLYQDFLSINNLISEQELDVELDKNRNNSRPSKVFSTYSNKKTDNKIAEEIEIEVEPEIHQEVSHKARKRSFRNLRDVFLGQKDKDSRKEVPENRREKFFSAINSFNPLTNIGNEFSQRFTPKNSIENELKRELFNINVIAFVGPAGTGKSSRANELAKQRNIELLIDDGLLIDSGRIKAGSTAKKAETRLESVRQALFMDESAALSMRRSLADLKPQRLMILGTSDKMILKICENLYLPEPVEYIRIGDVSTAEEQRQAKLARKTQGSHAIPVTSMEIKHEFSGSFFDPIRIWRKRFGEVDRVAGYSERTIVRPTFSTVGVNVMTDEAITSMVEIITKDIEGLAEVLDVEAITNPYGAILNLEISLFYGYNAQEVMVQVQDYIIEQVEYYTAINILSVNMSCRRVVHVKGKEWLEKNKYIQFQ